MDGGGGEDHLSLLPDEVLGRLPSTTEAARTSLLSRRWRRVWLVDPGDSTGCISSCLAAYTAHTDLPVRGVYVITTGESLRQAARCLSGELSWVSEVPGEDEEGLAMEMGVFELPCFENAIKI